MSDFVEGDPVAENVTKKVDISAGLKKEGDDDKTPVDGVSSKSVNLAMGLETVAPQEKKTPLSILSLTRGLTSVSNDNIDADAATSNGPIDEAAVLAALAAAGADMGSPMKGEAWEKKMDSKRAEKENVATADLLSSLGLTDASVEESWENKTHESSAAVGDAADILGKLGLTDASDATEAWEKKK